MEGRIQFAQKVVPPPGDARENWQILRAISEFFGSPLFVDSLEELNLRMGQIAPYLLKKDYFEQSHSLQFSEGEGKVYL